MSAELPKAILFDLDDTIIAYDAVTESVWHEVCGQFSPLLGRGTDELYTAIDEMTKWYMSDSERSRNMWLDIIAYRREIVTKAFDRLGITAPELAIALVDAYNKRRVDAWHVFPGGMDTLIRMKDSGLRLALISNGDSKSQRYKIERFGLTPFFDCILIESEFGVGKPDERVFRHACEVLNVAPSDAWMVGDNLERDIGGAQAVGIPGIWVDWRGGGLPESATVQPERIIRSIAELVR